MQQGLIPMPFSLKTNHKWVGEMDEFWLKNLVVVHWSLFAVTQLLDVLPVYRKEFLDIQEVWECKFVLKYICGIIKTHSQGLVIFWCEMIITIIATTERLFHIIDKKHFRKGKSTEFLWRCHFLFVDFYYFTVLFLVFIKLFW